MGKHQSHPVLFQDIADRVHQICLGSKFDVVTGILGDLAEEVIRILRPFCRGELVIFDMVFLLKDDSIQAGAEDLYGGLAGLRGTGI